MAQYENAFNDPFGVNNPGLTNTTPTNLLAGGYGSNNSWQGNSTTGANNNAFVPWNEQGYYDANQGVYNDFMAGGLTGTQHYNRLGINESRNYGQADGWGGTTDMFGTPTGTPTGSTVGPVNPTGSPPGVIDYVGPTGPDWMNEGYTSDWQDQMPGWFNLNDFMGANTALTDYANENTGFDPYDWFNKNFLNEERSTGNAEMDEVYSWLRTSNIPKDQWHNFASEDKETRDQYINYEEDPDFEPPGNVWDREFTAPNYEDVELPGSVARPEFQDPDWDWEVPDQLNRPEFNPFDVEAPEFYETDLSDEAWQGSAYHRILQDQQEQTRRASTTMASSRGYRNDPRLQLELDRRAAQNTDKYYGSFADRQSGLTDEKNRNAAMGYDAAMGMSREEWKRGMADWEILNGLYGQAVDASQRDFENKDLMWQNQNVSTLNQFNADRLLWGDETRSAWDKFDAGRDKFRDINTIETQQYKADAGEFGDYWDRVWNVNTQGAQTENYLNGLDVNLTNSIGADRLGAAGVEGSQLVGAGRLDAAGTLAGYEAAGNVFTDIFSEDFLNFGEDDDLSKYWEDGGFGTPPP